MATTTHTMVVKLSHKYACCFYPLSIFKSIPTSNGEGMGRKKLSIEEMRRIGCGEGANNRLGMYRI
jgi:hypothetical protein